VLFLREFEKAAEEGDGSKVTRFFKLFPLIGGRRLAWRCMGGMFVRGLRLVLEGA